MEPERPEDLSDVRLFPRITLDEWMHLKMNDRHVDAIKRGIEDVKPLC